MQCPECNSTHVSRQRRTAGERREYSAVFACGDCLHRFGISRLRRTFEFVVPSFLRMPWITLHARCPKCADMRVGIQRERDYIEDFCANPFRLLQRLLGARLYYCKYCRLQFHDVRSTKNTES